MPLTYPVPYADFFEKLPIKNPMLKLSSAATSSEAADGSVIVDARGERLWEGSVHLGRLHYTEARWVETMLQTLLAPGRTFLATDMRAKHPAADIDGTALGTASVIIGWLFAADARLIRLAGLPSGYKLMSGDYLSFTYGTSPIRYALHRVVDVSVTAGSDGTTPQFEVIPPLRPGAPAGGAVSLKIPTAKFVVKPGSYQSGQSHNQITEGISFDFIQTMR